MEIKNYEEKVLRAVKALNLHYDFYDTNIRLYLLLKKIIGMDCSKIIMRLMIVHQRNTNIENAIEVGKEINYREKKNMIVELEFCTEEIYIKLNDNTHTKIDKMIIIKDIILNSYNGKDWWTIDWYLRAKDSLQHRLSTINNKEFQNESIYKKWNLKELGMYFKSFEKK